MSGVQSPLNEERADRSLLHLFPPSLHSLRSAPPSFCLLFICSPGGPSVLSFSLRAAPKHGQRGRDRPSPIRRGRRPLLKSHCREKQLRPPRNRSRAKFVSRWHHYCERARGREGGGEKFEIFPHSTTQKGIIFSLGHHSNEISQVRSRKEARSAQTERE